MGCRSCRDKGRNQSKSIAPKLTKCDYCGRIDVLLPLKEANKRGSKVICDLCIRAGVGL